jgi:hypothetical protein
MDLPRAAISADDGAFFRPLKFAATYVALVETEWQ